MKRSCGCVSGEAKRAFRMLVVATARRTMRGADPSIRKRGKVPQRVLDELADNGYLTMTTNPTAYHVTEAGLRKLDEWRRLGMI